jgi:hypothetical protein
MFVLFEFGLRSIIRYELSSDAVLVRYFGMVFIRVPYEAIDDIREVSKMESTSRFAVRAGNRLLGPIVCIRRRGNWVNNLMLTPENPAYFVHEVKKHQLSLKQKS